MQKIKKDLAFSIDFEGFAEGMEESFFIEEEIPRFKILNELTRNVEHALSFLDKNNIIATFFILGWIARKFPEIIKNISKHGHEIASHSYYHKRLFNLPDSEIFNYIDDSKKILEDVSGDKVIGFRAPDFSINELNEKFFYYMYEIGYLYDSSIVSTNIHDVYGASIKKTEIYYHDSGLIEFPISNFLIFNKISLPVGGGGYLRLYPEFITNYFLKSNNDPMLYIHPYELSGFYPKEIKMGLYRMFRHTFNIERTESKITNIISNFNPVSVSNYLKKKKYID